MKPFKTIFTTKFEDPQECDYCLGDCCIQRVDFYINANLEETCRVLHNDASEVMHELN